MRCLVQRVTKASVTVDSKLVGSVGKGYLVLLGVCPEDDEGIADAVARKLVNLRIFEDEKGKMNRSITDVGGDALIVSQFTLYADCKHGNRPSFIGACEPKRAEELYRYFCDAVAELGIGVQRGIFGADMKVELLNDGPVTIMLDSAEIVKGR